MATLYVPEGYAQCLLRFTVNGDDDEMVCTLGINPGVAYTDGDDVADGVADACLQDTSLLGDTGDGMVTDYNFVGVTARFMTATGEEVGESVRNIQGTAVGSPLPNNCAYLVRKLTGLGGRGNRGRLFQPPFSLTEGDIDGAGNIDAVDVASLQTRWNGLYTELVANDLIPVLFHYPGVDPTPDPTTITGFSVRNRIVSQRRRLG